MSEFNRMRPIRVDDLLLTKLMPPRLHASLVQRAALFARLTQGLDQKLTLITAPTGFGKTTLVSLWLAQQNLPSAWLTLDENDNDPIRFWRYVISAFRRVNESLGSAALSMLRVSQNPPLQPLLTVLINDLSRLSAPTVLVLDDLHTMTAPDVLESLLFFIEHLPPNLHLIIMARSEPGLSLAFLRARGELNQLRADDLRFSEAEIQAFLRQTLSYALPEDDVKRVGQRLEARTEGWVAGIRLAALAMQGKNPSLGEFIETFNGEHHFVLEYLRKEVFEKQPPHVRAFLLRTSFLDRLCAPLCDAVMAAANTAEADSAGGDAPLNSGELLEELEQENLFVIRLGSYGVVSGTSAVSGAVTWYRYQALFAEALRHDALASLGEAAALRIQAEASRWYEAHGLIEEAINAALAAQQYERAARMMEQFIDLRQYNEMFMLRRWCEQLPYDLFSRFPLLAFNYALAVLFTANRYAPETAERIQPLLQCAEDAWRAQGQSAGVGQVYAVRGTLAWWQGDLQTGFAHEHLALSLLPEDCLVESSAPSHEGPSTDALSLDGSSSIGPVENRILWRAVALLGVGEESYLNGHLNEARGMLLETQALSGAVHNIHGVLAAMQTLAKTDFESGEMEQASAGFQQVLADAVGGDEMLDDQAIALYWLARIAYERSELSSAEEHASRALELSTRRQVEDISVAAAVLLARIAYARGEVSRAQNQLKALLTRVHRPALMREIWEALARLALASGDLSSARRWCEMLGAQAERSFASQREREQILLARLAIAEGQPEQALALLQPWLEDAQTQGRVLSEAQILLIMAQAQAVVKTAVAVKTTAAGETALVDATLADVLALGQPHRFRRLFLDEGEPLARLLQAAAPNLSRRSRGVNTNGVNIGVYATALLHAFPAAQPARSGPDSANSVLLVEPLSTQEIRVLRLIAAGRSNPEIAGELVVSVNTIKTQVQSIYRKLNVNTREEASEAARALNLI